MSKEKSNIPETWRWVTLDDIGIVVNGGTPSTKESEFWEGEIPWVTPADLSNYEDTYIAKGKRSISEIGLEYSSAILLPKNSIIFSSRAPIGYVAITKNELATNQGFKNLILSESINSKYTYYYLKTVKELAENMASGTTFLELSTSKFKQIPFPLAPREEQNRIVEKIEELFSELNKSIDIIKSTFNKIELNKVSIIEKYLNNPEWEKVKIENIVSVTSSKRIFKSEYTDFGVPFFRIKEIVELTNDYEKRDSIFISEERYNTIKMNYGVPKKNDLLITAIGTIGVIYIVPDDKPFYFKDGNILWLKTKNNANSYFLKLSIERELNKIKQFSGSTYTALNIEKLKSLEIPNPKIEIQNKVSYLIEQQITNLRYLETEMKIQLEKTQTLYQKILQDAFKGKLTKQIDTDTPINILSNNIKKEREDYLKKQLETIKNRPKIKRMEKEKLSIIEVLNKYSDPISSKRLWEESEHENIEDFYANLKEVKDKIIQDKSFKDVKISLK